MRRRSGRVLLWTTIALVAGAFMLALAGQEISSPRLSETVLNWHEWLGLLSLGTLAAALVLRWIDQRPTRLALPHWLPRLRGSIEVGLYILLVLQPLSGWLLASHEGKLAAFLGWTLPPLAQPSSAVAHYGYVYHGLGGALILVIVALSLRLNLSAYVQSLVGSVQRRRGHAARARRRVHRHRT